jgi:hypothetical protein
LAAGAGRASRRDLDSGTFAFATLGLGVHAVFSFEHCQHCFHYAPGAALYVSVKRDLTAARASEVTFGLDTDPLFSVAAVAVLLGDLLD